MKLKSTQPPTPQKTPKENKKKQSKYHRILFRQWKKEFLRFIATESLEETSVVKSLHSSIKRHISSNEIRKNKPKVTIYL